MTATDHTPQLQAAPEARFFADVMLGSLAKWLRLLGYDTAYQKRISDSELAEAAQSEDRIVLTRDARLCQRRLLRGRHLLIKSQELESQLHQVLRFLDAPMPPRLSLSRCVRCNRRLQSLPRSEARKAVPPYVWKTQSEFKSCPGCGRIFWKGTHRERMAQRLARWASRGYEEYGR